MIGMEEKVSDMATMRIRGELMIARGEVKPRKSARKYGVTGF
jgi:hypothetical protein